MRKLDLKLNYNSGLFNNKNEQVLAKSINILVDKINELVSEVENLKDKIDLKTESSQTNNI